MLINQFKPDFYDEFRCTGSECKYTCCQEWNIDITKDDYYRVRNAKMSKEMREIAQSCHIRNKLPENDGKFGYIKLNDDGFCPLLSEEGMCRLQIECGYDVLTNACKVFPRITSGSPAGIERSLSIGCEAAVKLLLEQRGGINFVQDKFNLMKIERGEHGFFAEQYKEMPIAAYYWDIKALGLTILQCTAHSLDDRMMLLGIAMQELEKIAGEGRLSEIPPYVDRMIAGVADVNVGEVFDDMEINSGMVLDKEWCMVTENLKQINIPFSERVLSGLGYSQGESDGKIIVYHNMDMYREARERLAKFEAKHPRVLENIMVNEFHRRAIPMDNNFNIWDSFIQFAYEYVFVKLTVAGYLDDSISEDDFIRAVVMIGRRYGHSAQMSERITELTKEREIASLGYMAIMIKG